LNIGKKTANNPIKQQTHRISSRCHKQVHTAVAEQYFNGTPYQLHARSHTLALINKTKFLNDADFIIHLLYKYSY